MAYVGVLNIGRTGLNPCLNPAPQVVGSLRCGLLLRQCSACGGTGDLGLRHCGAGAQRQSRHSGEHQCFGSVHGQYSCLCGPSDLSNGAGVWRTICLVLVIDKPKMGCLGAVNYPETTQLSFAACEEIPVSAPTSCHCPVKSGLVHR
jgi:hypothetical protein